MQATRLQAGLLAEWLQRLEDLHYSPFTVRGYRLAVQKLLRTYPDVPLERFTPEHIERHIYALPVGPRTKATEIGHLRSFFRWLIDHKRLLKENPCDRAERPRWTWRLRPCPSFAEVEAIVARARTDEERLLILLYFHTAARLREGLGIDVRDVNLSAREIVIRHGKGDKDRVVLFDPRETPEHVRLGPLLERRMTPGWVFASPRYDGHRRSLEWVSSVFTRTGGEAGLRYPLTAHVLRHAWTRWAKTCGLPIEMVAQQLGHASILTTQRLYGRLDVADRRAAMDRFMRVPTG